jgi:CheY-like chemotaxis protein
MDSPSLCAVLLVEDNEDDVLLFQRSWRKAGMPHRLFYAGDGAEAIAFLAGEDALPDPVGFARPKLVFLDLKMPRVGGLEVLQWARQRAELNDVCFVVLTSSPEPSDVAGAYAFGANCYLVKGISPETLREVFAQLEASWPGIAPRGRLNVREAELGSTPAGGHGGKSAGRGAI